MTPRERVAAVLACRQPDRVPYCEIHVDQQIAEQVLGRLARLLGKDNICYVLRAPVYTKRIDAGGDTAFYTEGLIRSEADLELLDLPDPDDDALYAEAEVWASRKGDYSLWLVTRLGLFPAMLSMGMERFFIALHEDPGFVEKLLDIYCEWTAAMAKRICQLDFDVFCSTDDFAGKHGTLFSPSFFHDIVMPRFRKIAEHITKPWVMHSDGKLCLLGNVDLNLLMLGEPQEVKEEVRGLIRDVGPGGGYIVTSGNSLTYYCKLENITAMIEAAREYGVYPLKC